MDTFAADPTHGFDLVALSTYTALAFDAYKVADAYRARGVPVVFGGLHATVLPDEVAGHADAVIIGEGESNSAGGGGATSRPAAAPARGCSTARPWPGRFDLRECPVPLFDLLCGHPSPVRPGRPAGRAASCTAGGRTTASPSRAREAAPGTASSAPPPSCRSTLPPQAGRTSAVRGGPVRPCGGARSSSLPTIIPLSTSHGRETAIARAGQAQHRDFTETDVSQWPTMTSCSISSIPAAAGRC